MSKKDRNKRLQRRAELLRAKEKREKMGRHQDLDYVNGKLQELQEELQAVNAKYQEYNRRVDDIISEMLDKAGLLEKFKKLNTERDSVRQQAQSKLNDLQAKMRDLQGIRTFLLERVTLEGPAEMEEEEDKAVSGEDETEEDGEDTAPPRPEF